MRIKVILTESQYRRVIKEALRPSEFRQYVQSFDKDRYADIFKTLGDKFEHDRNYYRIYIPLSSNNTTGPISSVEKEVRDYLSSNGYTLLDYIKGTVRYGESKNITTVGRALTKLKNTNLLKQFVSDEKRKSITTDTSDLMVVISRHPYDIAGSDTDRNWTNCMTIGRSDSPKLIKLNDELKKLKKERSSVKGKKTEMWNTDENFERYRYLTNRIDKIKQEIEGIKETGENVEYLLHDVKEGSLVSYLIRRDDKNINNPISVLNIKPFIQDKDPNNFILLSDSKMYGQGRPEFKNTVDNVLDIINGEKKGLFCMSDNLYKDDLNTAVYVPEQNELDEIMKKSDSIHDKTMKEIKKSIDKFYYETNINYALYDFVNYGNFNYDPNKPLDRDKDYKFIREIDSVLMKERKKIIDKSISETPKPSDKEFAKIYGEYIIRQKRIKFAKFEVFYYSKIIEPVKEKMREIMKSFVKSYIETNHKV